MAIKNFFKKHLTPIIYILSCIILGVLFYKHVVFSIFSTPLIVLFTGFTSLQSIVAILLYPLSLLILFFVACYILTRYIKLIILDFSNKKLLRPIILLIILAILIAICIVFNFVLSASLNNLFLITIYILGTIIIPLILIGSVLLNNNLNKKSKIKRTILLIIFAIIIYAINIPTLLVGTTYINTYISNHTSNTTKTPNLEYLSNYAQKMTNKGFIDKYDVEYIINIASLRSENVVVNYSFDGQSISISNKDANFKSTIEDNLKWDYYKFNYTYENSIVTINIEKYANTTVKEEKNEKIVLFGNKRADLIKNTKSENVTPDSTNFVLDNSLTISSSVPKNISDLRLLLVYDDTTKNFVPVVDNTSNISMIFSYKVTSTSLEIVLNDNTSLNVPDYTIRLNRYDDNIQIPENKNLNYYYYYEPGVTTSKNNVGQTVLTIDFDNTLSLDKIKNIEIIFGNN